MVRITKVYTKQGDRGRTRLAGGEELPKDAPRIEAYGTVDELSSQIGAALAALAPPGRPPEEAGGSPTALLSAVQNDLFHLGSSLAFLPDDEGRVPGPSLEARHVEALEREIDRVNAELEPLESFVLPGGAPGAAQLHLARCVCRRAERRLVRLGREEGRHGRVPEHALVYLNRLSDLLFVLARAENRRAGVAEPTWDSHS
ncbi:MAG: cob(I)yrinic acid a,c-diamide adenosyltransferase [Acidobacteriota bacterium]|jgi:cob(I)alamin adenosyltransferase